MNLLHSGVDIAVIALWLGHESTQTTSAIYLHADMKLKEQALARTTPPHTKPGRYPMPATLGVSRVRSRLRLLLRSVMRTVVAEAC